MERLFGDAVGMNNIHFLRYPYNLKKEYQWKIYKIFRKIELKTHISLTNKYKDIKHSTLFNTALDNSSIIVFLNPITIYLTKELLDFLRQKYSAKLILLFLDPIQGNSSKDAKEKIDWFDIVYTFDQADAYQYGLNYFFQVYSKFQLSTNPKINKSLYFVGWGNKANRENILNNIGQVMKEKNLEFDFNLVSNRRKRISKFIAFHRKPIPYEKIIKGVMSSNCILDIVQETQSGATLKYIEAVVFNKKLLTNNVNISEFPYYNSKYMRIYKDISDIDFSWVSEKEHVDYSYHDDFSPRKILELIQSDVEKLENE